MNTESARNSLTIPGLVFVASFPVGLLLVGDQAGSFADSEGAYREIFSDTTHRAQDIAGSLLLIVAAIGFGMLTQSLAHLTGPGVEPPSSPIRVGGLLAAGAMLASGAAFLTVPMSLALGDWYGDPGIVTAQPVLPHFGYILLVVGSSIPAALLMVLVSRSAKWPKWFVWLTRILAPVLILTGPSVIAMLLLPIWAGLTVAITWKEPTIWHR